MSFNNSGRLAGAVVLLTACVAGPKPMRLGDSDAATPSFAMPAAAKSAERATVKLAEPAYVAMLFVVPGRGSVVVFPADSTAANFVDAGEHDVEVHWTMSAVKRDSLYFLAARHQAAREGGYGRPRGIAGEDDTLATEPQRGRGPLPELSPAESPVGYLLLVTSPSNLSLPRLKHRVEGMTIPFEDGEALQTVMKLVKATLPEGATLAGYAQEVAR
jgi:hypothetical protein